VIPTQSNRATLTGGFFVLKYCLSLPYKLIRHGKLSKVAG
jgi:hypothetical protein